MHRACIVGARRVYRVHGRVHGRVQVMMCMCAGDDVHHHAYAYVQVMMCIVSGPPPVLAEETNASPLFRDFVRMTLVKDPPDRPFASELKPHAFVRHAAQSCMHSSCPMDSCCPMHSFCPMHSRELCGELPWRQPYGWATATSMLRRDYTRTQAAPPCVQVRGARPEPLRNLVQEQLAAVALRREQEDAEQEEERILRLEYEMALRASPISAADLDLEDGLDDLEDGRWGETASEHQRRGYGSPSNQDLGV